MTKNGVINKEEGSVKSPHDFKCLFQEFGGLVDVFIDNNEHSENKRNRLKPKHSAQSLSHSSQNMLFAENVSDMNGWKSIGSKVRLQKCRS